MTTLVIDASVAIKWVVSESGSAEALELRRHNLAAPDLLVPECANILWKKVRRKELSPEEADIGAQLLQRADVDLVPTRPLLAASARLAVALDHPAYDCVYLCLAQSAGWGFVTADDRLRAKVQRYGLGVQVLSLGEAGGL